MPLLSRLRGLFGRKAMTVLTGGVTGGGWYPLIREPFAGAWQRNAEVNPALASTFFADFACKTLIARDISKLPIRLVARDSDGIWTETTNAAYSPVLRRPNHYQNRIQFVESWILSKLARGNTYVLKERDNRGVVVALYVLDPRRVQPLIADDDSVFYQLSCDDLNVRPSQIVVPSTEIIHDRMNCDHWLVGVPPIYASGLAAMQGLNIQLQSIRLFKNNAQPGGVLTAPGKIEPDTVERLKTDWKQRYSGENVGNVAVLGDGLKFEKMALTAVEGQMLEQLKWSAENVCSTYHVPPFMINVGAEPATGSAQERTMRYYQQCLQSYIEEFELCLDEGLGLGENQNLGVEVDINNLLRMDTSSLAAATVALVRGGVKTPNNGRKDFNLPPLKGGDTVYLQQQDIPMSVAASQTVHPNEPQAPTPPTESQTPANDDELQASKAMVEIYKGFA